MNYDVNVDVPKELVNLGIITSNPMTDKNYTPRTIDYPADDYNGKSSTTKKVIKYGLVATLIAAVIYGGYKLISKGKAGQLPISFTSLKTKVAENIGKVKKWVTGLFKRNPAETMTKSSEKSEGIFAKAKNWVMGFFKKASNVPPPITNPQVLIPEVLPPLK